MNKIAAAILLVLAVTSSHGAVIYDKDGTTLSIGGYVKAAFYDGNNVNRNLGRNANTLVNTSRLNISGTTKLSKEFSAISFAEWNMPAGRRQYESPKSRDQYIGFNSSNYGKLYFGKTTDMLSSVIASTGLYADFGAEHRGYTAGDRRTGTVKYVYDRHGFNFGFTFQFPSDETPVAGYKDYVRSGYSVLLGYTFDNVLGKNLTLKAGYSLLHGQDLEVDDPFDDMPPFLKFRQYGISLSYGDRHEGLYIAASANKFLLDYTIFNVYGYDLAYIEELDYAAGNEYSLFFDDFGRMIMTASTLDCRGFDIVAQYAFDNGIKTFAGYNMSSYRYKFGGDTAVSFFIKHLVFNINYTYKNFFCFAEAQLQVGNAGLPHEYEEVLDQKIDLNMKSTFALGVKYVF